MLRLIVVKKAAHGGAGSPIQGLLRIGGLNIPCAIGASGIRAAKREGDRATPAGSWPLLFGFYRPDRWPRPGARIPMRPLNPLMGWCDDPVSPAYNRPIALPFAAGHEVMWREDHLYDVVIVLGHNLRPRRKQFGSAIFLHCAHDGLAPTAGCIALRPADMRRILPRLPAKTVMTVR